jgi:hypothetical protein
VYGSHPSLLQWGTKSLSRISFKLLGLPVAPGFEFLDSEDALVGAIDELWDRNPDLSKVMTKLDDGVSGRGDNSVQKCARPQQWRDA